MGQPRAYGRSTAFPVHPFLLPFEPMVLCFYRDSDFKPLVYRSTAFPVHPFLLPFEPMVLCFYKDSDFKPLVYPSPLPFESGLKGHFVMILKSFYLKSVFIEILCF